MLNTGIDSIADRPVADLENEVATLAAHVAAATARLLALLAELDRREAWAAQGFTSLAAWLGWRAGLDPVAAREHVRVARRLAELPRIAAAFGEGRLSYSKVRALTRIARPETEATLVDIARAASAAQLERIVRGYRRADPDAEARQVEKQQQCRRLDAFFDEDGMLVVRGRLSPEAGAKLMKALEVARDELLRDKPKDVEIEPGQARADALARVADRALAGGGEEHRASDRTMVVLHVDRDVLAEPATADGHCELENGPRVSAESARRLACDCSLVVMEHGPDGQVTAGRKTRVLTAAQERALRARDGGHCTYPGCTHRIVDAHHAVHWVNGGPTELSNLCLACTYHHALLHEQGWHTEILDDGHVRWLRPDGRPLPDAPPLPSVVGHALPALRRLIPTSASSESLASCGDRCDTGWVVSGLLWQASGPHPVRIDPRAEVSVAAPGELDEVDEDTPTLEGTTVNVWRM